MTEPEQSVADVKRALLRDIDAGKVHIDDGGWIWVDVDDERVDINAGVTALFNERLCVLAAGANTAASIGTWRLTDAGRAYLEAGTDG